MKSFPEILALAALSISSLGFAEPVAIFDGKTLDGWESPTPKLWKVNNGIITGGDGTTKIPHNDFLCTKKSYQNFTLRLMIRLTGDPATGLINSGIQIRSQRVPKKKEASGYQCDYGDPTWWGAIYDEARRNKLIARSDMEKLDPVIKRGDWNEYVIRAEGPRIRTFINGVQGVDYKEADPKIAMDGIIGIQIHSGGNAKVEVKDITIEELPPTPGAPTWASLAKPAMKEGNAPEAKGANTPEQELATFTLPEGFKAELVAAEIPAEGIGKFVQIAFDAHGALWTTTALEYPVDGNENPAAADALYESKAKDKVLVYDRDPASPTGLSPKPRVFAEGLAIPLGVLPFGNGCYVQHGHDIAFLEDTDGDGKADKRTVVLTGFGVQDSHLFPHQFTRAPGGWLWMAQGAFNYSNVSRPGEEDKAVKFDQTRMAKFRPDGTGFDITSNGPCNIWGLVINGEGESFIQEANDFGYPVMPFDEYANYPGCSNGQWKSYAPEYPGTATFRMGGTGLSGLALTDATGPFPEPWRDMMLVANPITNRIQGIRMNREGAKWTLEKPVDFLTSSDPWFRPVAMATGPDGCIYIVDWYNKIISHNEVPRNHPDRDKTRGRIWRIKATATKPFEVPDFTQLDEAQLVAKLGSESVAQSHLAWQELASRKSDALSGTLRAIVADGKSSAARRIQALWVLRETGGVNLEMLVPLFKDENRNLRFEAIAAAAGDPALWENLDVAPFADDPDPRVRAEAIRSAGKQLQWTIKDGADRAIAVLLSFVKEPLAEPIAASTQNGKPIKVGAAYDREFERYLVRLFLENHPVELSAFLDSDAAASLSPEARLLGSLALDASLSASLVAAQLPKIQRPPGQEEILRLAEFPDEPGVGEALTLLLSNSSTRDTVIDSLLAMRARLDAKKLSKIMSKVAEEMLAGDEPSQQLGASLASSFGLASVEPTLVRTVMRDLPESTDQEVALSAPALSALSALRDLRSGEAELLLRIASHGKEENIRDIALAALASSRSPDAAKLLFSLYPELDPARRGNALNLLSSSQTGAKAIVAALVDGTIAKDDMNAALLDRILAVLDENDPALAQLSERLGTFFRPVLTLDGNEDAWTRTSVSIDGPCTFESWVRLDPMGRPISNSDGIFGVPDKLDINFAGALARVYRFPPVLDVAITKKPMTPGLWTHVAATRDDAGIWKMYLDGELAETGTIPSPGKIETIRLSWTTAKGGTRGAMAEARIWDHARSPEEIRSTSDRSLPANTPGLLFTSANGNWGKPEAGAKVILTSDFPPILTEQEATALDAKYTRFRELATKPGDIAKGKELAAICSACHLIGTDGGNIGPNLSGVGAMGTEGILRNILQPNAAMENGYRIFRVEMKNGDITDVFFVSEDKDAVVIRMPGAPDRRIPKSEVASTKFLRRSLMPEGLLDTMDDDQVRDLLTYLLSLK